MFSSGVKTTATTTTLTAVSTPNATTTNIYTTKKKNFCTFSHCGINNVLL